MLVEVNCETDFVANTEEFKQLVKDIALHIASPSAPQIRQPREDVPAGRARVRAAASSRRRRREPGKPDDVIEKIVEGKLKAFYKDDVLLDQPFVKDDSKTIQQFLDETSAKVGEKVAVRRFVRYQARRGDRGEGRRRCRDGGPTRRTAAPAARTTGSC